MVFFCSRHTIDPPPVVTPTAVAVDSSDEENSESTKKKSSTLKSDKNEVVEIPESLRFDPKSIENKPKGLVDSLTKYFTPGMSHSYSLILFTK